jgi:hypothetical protein
MRLDEALQLVKILLLAPPNMNAAGRQRDAAAAAGIVNRVYGE